MTDQPRTDTTMIGLSALCAITLVAAAVRSPLNDYQRSKAAELVHLQEGTYREERKQEVHLCAKMCSELLDCRSFDYNLMTHSCRLLPWTQNSANVALQKNINYDVYQKKVLLLYCALDIIPPPHTHTDRPVIILCPVHNPPPHTHTLTVITLPLYCTLDMISLPFSIRHFCEAEKQRLQNVPIMSNCFMGRGEGYRGKASMTTSGIPCQRWDSQTPHKHRFLPEKYPCKGLEENYCRNPDGSEAPWCFTTNPNMRVAYCFQIKRCPDDVPDATGCFTGNGETYDGRANKTRKGIPCSYWSEKSKDPHRLQENYCRNPDGDSHGPWCYTKDPNTPFDYCAIKLCDGETPPGLKEAESIKFDSCGKRYEKPVVKARIVGGSPGNSPWTISLRNRQGDHFCGGSLVKEDWVISTRQCFSSCDADLSGYQAMVGTLFTNPKATDPDKQSVAISQIMCGPSDSSLVMLKLERPVTLNSRVALICLPPERYIVPDDTQCEIAGWGDTQGTGHENVLKIAKFRVMNHEDCNVAHKNRVRDSEICTKPTAVDVGACEGDYGGPLACLTHDCYVLEGVIIPARGCGKKNVPAIFTRVSVYVDWIYKVMRMI
ncbi:hepatocyte growth factor-like protein [Pseudophryne corroboree]|uniref:hepatocyte growth factor-like protein n=1 Tax=Pseudophryne corroboree TaxID=495146 RepID=UPI0030813F00